jgi:hypothetical protein
MTLKERIDEIMSMLPISLISTNANKKYLLPYVKHIPSDVENAQSEFLKLCDEILGGDIWTSPHKSHRQGYIGGYLDNCANIIGFNGHLLKVAWSRFMCIDKDYREWLEPEFAINSKKYNIEMCCCVNSLIPEYIEYFRDKKIDLIIK